MKKLYPFLMLSLLFFLASSMAPAPVTITQSDLKYIASKIKDPNCVIGVFKVPDVKDDWHKLQATGDYPENDSTFISFFMHTRILKMNVERLLKGEADSCVFTQQINGGFNESELTTFYPFPGVTWLLVLNKGLIDNQPAGWVKDVKDRGQYKWMNPSTVFVMDEYKGNYYETWNKKYDVPVGVENVGKAFIDDVARICKDYKSMAPELPAEEHNAKITAIQSSMKTADGKSLCTMLMKK